MCRWYSEKFVKGNWDKEECVSERDKYKACLSEHLKDKQLRQFLEAEGPESHPIGVDSNTATKADWGRFYSMFLKTRPRLKRRETHGKFLVFFWLGAEVQKTHHKAQKAHNAHPKAYNVCA
uniref:uncharacterized protein LOC105349646 n=1 Tax=Fragaria vesca subsp. vesca TaxID=101020 RepID=UPI0005C919C2|nr:PREDICTED: uncharacterized protein LOC105349646 [Fragaria vesca subsp. vesca]